MLKNTLLLISILFVSIAIVFSAYILKDKQICCGIDLCKNITNICNGDNPTSDTVLTSSKGTSLTLKNIKSSDTLENGTELEGSVKSGWYFEGQFPVKVTDIKGNELFLTSAQAQSDWTQDGDVPFKVTIDLPIIQDNQVIIIFQKDNPSGLVENDDSVSIRLNISASLEQMSIKVYFPNTNYGSSQNCALVFPVERNVPKVTAVGKVSLEQLLEGPTDSEKSLGFYTNINSGVEIQILSIANGVAKVDFNQQLQEGIGGSCKVQSIRAEIEQTLKQFPTVDDVVISINGQTEDILQP